MRAFVAFAVLPITQVRTGPMIEVDLFRAWQASQVHRYEIANNNLADVGGVLKYIHTEIVVESEQDTDRENRKYNIDVIAYARFRVRNVDSIVASTRQQAQDFGPFSAYDMGESTQDELDALYEEHSDMVGLQPVGGDPRIAFPRPIYWFSVSGFCPNLPFGEKGTPAEPNAQCLRYGGRNGDVLTGGLCPEAGTSTLLSSVRRRLVEERIDPTGQPGCVYSYNQPQTVRIDDLAGLTEIDCGGSVCTDWKDFRQHCTRGDLKFMFNRDRSGNVQEVDFCVEYDIHPWCARDCSDPRCQRLMEMGVTVEYGVPFWQGRCVLREGERRMEELAGRSVLPETGAHLLVDPVLLANAPACDCEVNPTVGINYCDRAFSGVCVTCKIPGCSGHTDAPQPLCTLDVLSRADYLDRADRKPLCASAVPTDVCCLYTGECDGSSDPQLATLDDNGLLLVRSRRNTDDVATFLERAAVGSSYTSNKFRAAAYEEWGTQPISRNLESTLARLAAFPEPPTTTAPVTAAPPTLAPSATTATPDDGGGSTEPVEEESSSSALGFILILLIVFIVAGCGVSFYLGYDAAEWLPAEWRLAQWPAGGEDGVELPQLGDR